MTHRHYARNVRGLLFLEVVSCDFWVGGVYNAHRYSDEPLLAMLEAQ